MLLLVLILVMIAFGLLLVGYLSASVLWAWVSVAVSLAAAGVLLFDWLQRRSVVRAGDEAGGELLPDPVAVERTTAVPAPARPAFGAGDGGRVDLDPVTEVIPVVRPSVPHGAGVDPRFDPDADAQQTVMMPAVQPSGSPAGPSGATPGQTPSSESSSPSVTISKDKPQVPDGPDGGDQATVVVRAAGQDAPSDATADPVATTATPAATTTATPVPSDAPFAAGRPPSSASDPDPADSSPVSRSPGPADPDRPEANADVEATAAVSPPPRDERAGAPAAPPAAEAPGSLFTSGPATNGAPPAGAPEQGTAAPPPPVSADPVVEPPAQVPADVPQADLPVEASGVDTAHADGEAPEERSDPEVAALVAGLEDEVLVIDEQPRYHVTGCRALAAVALIPLPVREAVELGFTPCGWCSPDHALASRHRATAR